MVQVQVQVCLASVDGHEYSHCWMWHWAIAFCQSCAIAECQMEHLSFGVLILWSHSSVANILANGA
jgi:hypothetical protein